MAQPILGPFAEWDIFPLHEEKGRPKSSGTPSRYPLVVHNLRLYHEGQNALIGLDALSDQQRNRHSASSFDPALQQKQRQPLQQEKTTFVTTPRASSIQTTAARKSPSRSSNKLIHRHILDDDENPNVVSQSHAAASNSNVDLTVRQEGEARDDAVFWRGMIHFNIPLSRFKRTNNKQAYDDEGETTSNIAQAEGGSVSHSSNQEYDHNDHDGLLSRLSSRGVDLVRGVARARGASISNGFSLVIQGTVSHYESVWGTPQSPDSSGPSTKSGKNSTRRDASTSFPSVNATNRASASRSGGVQNANTASSSSPRAKRRQNEGGVLHTTNNKNSHQLLLHSVVPCSHGCTRTYRVESLNLTAQELSLETQRNDALLAWMRATNQRAGTPWPKDGTWYVNWYKKDFPRMVKVGEQPDRRPENKRCHIRSAIFKAITVPKYRKIFIEEHLMRKKEVLDLLSEQQQMKRQGFALQHLLSSLDATTDDLPQPPPNPSTLHSLIGGSQPDSEENQWMEDSAAPSSNYTRYATAVDVEETKEGIVDIGQEIESHNDDSPFNIKVKLYPLLRYPIF
ncbi:hypothetical protein CPB86DRAFT_324642 [Serendipita vermifera]|nr:hypothetical protein CPB86DRAFT_324642 [Serendipita vermifera]